jgi:hypothetical protein
MGKKIIRQQNMKLPIIIKKMKRRIGDCPELGGSRLKEIHSESGRDIDIVRTGRE